MMNNIECPFMSVKELAQWVGMSENFVYSEMRKGRLKYTKFGRIYRISKEHIVDYVQSCKR